MSGREKALVTGSTSGIGLAFARLLALQGFDVVLTGRQEGRLVELKNELECNYQIKADFFVADLSEEWGATKLYEACHQRGHEISVLINNAGIGAYGQFTECPKERIREILHVNVEAMTMLARLFGNDLKNRSKGHMLLVASTIAFRPALLYSVYAASKAYILSFGDALYQELKPYGVHVTTLCPGLTKTNFFHAAGEDREKQLLRFGMAPEKVAREALEGLFAGKVLVIPGLLNKFDTLLARWLPTSWRRVLYAGTRRVDQPDSDC